MILTLINSLASNRHIGEAEKTCRQSAGARLSLRSEIILFVILSCLWARDSYGEVLATGRLEKCIADGETENLSCANKLVVTLTVANGQTLDTEKLEFSLSCVNSPSGQCPCSCNAAEDPNCSCRDLAAPMRVSLTKSPLWASYPLKYLQSFNWKPVEAILRPSNKVCKDGDYELSPTCGWYYASGKQVANSQGFCCECNDKQIFDDTFGSSKQRTRANLDCDFTLSMIIGKVPVSAHCLQFDPVWYSGYQLGTASLQFDINVTVSVPTTSSSSPSGLSTSTTNTNSSASTSGTSTASGATTRTETLLLNPSSPTAISSGRLVAAKLVGDLAMYTQLPDFSNRLLMLPEPSQGSTDRLNTIMATNRSSWMVVDRSSISLDGNECDKVGTSFTAFRFQTNACARAAQTCLSNQLKDLWEGDLKRIQSGLDPLYMVTQYTGGDDTTLDSFNGGPLSFALPVTSQSQSVVTLTVAADSVRLVTNRSPGKISGARVCRFQNNSCGGFESGNRGYIRLNVTNTGRLPADYTLTVTNCSINVRPIQARSLALAAGQTLALTPPLELYVEDASKEPNRTCWVTLYDSQGGVQDSILLSFYTNATRYSPRASGGVNGTGDGVGVKRNATTCSEACPKFYDVFCFVKRGCWGQLGKILGILGGVVAGIGLLVVALKFGWLASLFGSCCGCCGGGGGGGAGAGVFGGGAAAAGAGASAFPPASQQKMPHGHGHGQHPLPPPPSYPFPPGGPPLSYASRRRSLWQRMFNPYDNRQGEEVSAEAMSEGPYVRKSSWYNPGTWGAGGGGGGGPGWQGRMPRRTPSTADDRERLVAGKAPASGAAYKEAAPEGPPYPADGGGGGGSGRQQRKSWYNPMTWAGGAGSEGGGQGWHFRMPRLSRGPIEGPPPSQYDDGGGRDGGQSPPRSRPGSVAGPGPQQAPRSSVQMTLAPGTFDPVRQGSVQSVSDRAGPRERGGREPPEDPYPPQAGWLARGGPRSAAPPTPPARGADNHRWGVNPIYDGQYG